MANFYRFKRAKDIISTMTDYTLTHTNKINDFTAGSAIQTLYEAIATELEKYYYLNVENYKYAIWNSIYQTFGLTRTPELKAFGNVTVTFTAPLDAAYTIPKGTKVVSSDDYYAQTFETLDAYTIPANASYATFPVYCTTGGTYGNIPARVLDTITNVPNLDSITNTEAFQTGKDEESLTETRRKFRGYIQALQRGTVQAIQFGAKNVPNVDGVYVDESIGYVRVYCHDANGDLNKDLQTLVQNEEYYWKPVGIPVEVFPVHKTTMDVNVTIDVPNTSLQTDLLASQVGDMVVKYLNSMSVHDPLVVNDMIQKVMDMNDVGIVDSQVNVMANPDAAIRGGLAVSDTGSIIINEHLYPKSIYEPKDRTIDENYIVSNPEDHDPNEYAPIDDDDVNGNVTSTTTWNINPDPNTEITTGKGTTTSTTPYVNTSSTTPKGTTTTTTVHETTSSTTGNKDTTTSTSLGHGNSLIYPELDFALSNPFWDEPDDDGISSNYVDEAPFTIVTNYDTKTIDYAVADGSSIGMLTDAKGTSVSSIRLRNTDGSRLAITFGDSVKNITVDYFKPKPTTTTTTDKNGNGPDPKTEKPDDTITIALSDDHVYKNFEIYPTADQIYIMDTNDKSKTTFSRKDLTFTRVFSSQKVTLVYTPDGSTIGFLATKNVQKNLTMIYRYDVKGGLESSETKFTSANGELTDVTYNGKGELRETDVYDSTGKLITSTDGDGKNLITTTTSTTTSNDNDDTTTTSNDVPETTTTTTAYPFKYPVPVSGSDAPEDGYLPVYSRYMTAGNELIKAGHVTVSFKINSEEG